MVSSLSYMNTYLHTIPKSNMQASRKYYEITSHGYSEVDQIKALLNPTHPSRGILATSKTWTVSSKTKYRAVAAASISDFGTLATKAAY